MLDVLYVLDVGHIEVVYQVSYVHRVTVDRHDPTPIYLQIAAILKAKILAGEYAPRQMLPSELHLQQEHGVARATVRHAIEALRAEGLVYTLPQRGTYVSPR